MICKCCGKEIVNETSYWHKKCIRSFFNMNSIPEIHLSLDDFVIENSNKKFIPGVQKKLSIHIAKNIVKSTTYFDKDSNYIIKPYSQEYEDLVESEHTTMLMGKEYGLDVAENGLLLINGNYSYITKRFDRVKNDKIHVEDFCQLSNKQTENKYVGSYEMIGKIIDKYSSFNVLDKIKLFKIVLFSF